MKTLLKTIGCAALVGGVLWWAGCGGERADETPASEEAPAATEAEAAVAPLADGGAGAGRVIFTQTDAGVRVFASILGLSEGTHGFHIHETGDCSAPDGSSAGGHYNPGGSPHGAPDAPAGARHMGDLGNLQADDKGRARLNRVDPLLKLSGPDSIVGKAVIIHAGADDFTSQPSGDAGARLACGVITASAVTAMN